MGTKQVEPDTKKPVVDSLFSYPNNEYGYVLSHAANVGFNLACGVLNDEKKRAKRVEETAGQM